MLQISGIIVQCMALGVCASVKSNFGPGLEDQRDGFYTSDFGDSGFEPSRARGPKFASRESRSKGPGFRDEARESGA
jgi:hypothetical protein